MPEPKEPDEGRYGEERYSYDISITGSRKRKKYGGPLKAANDHVDLRFADIEAPDSQERKQRRVAVNARTDALEHEYAYGRLSEAAYRAGRIYQAVLERSGHDPSISMHWPTQERVDASRSTDGGLVRALDAAGDVVDMLKETRPVVGWHGERILSLVLGRGMSLGEAAAQLMTGGGSISKHATSFYAWLFRQVLEALAIFWSTEGQPGRWRRLTGSD